MYLNRVTIAGNTGKDPEIKAFESGSKLASFSIATTKTFKNKAGEVQKLTEWHNINIWNEKLVSIVEKYVKKGTALYIEGELKTRKWDDKNGVTHYSTTIECNSIQLLGSKPKNEDNGTTNTPEQAEISDPETDDLPF